MNTKTKMIVAGACLALAGCGGGGGGGPGAGPVIIEPIVPVVMSATHGSVDVETDAASIVVNSIDLDAGTFSVTITLADGITEVTMTDLNVDNLDEFGFGSSAEDGIRVKLDNGAGDDVWLYVGLLPGADEDALITADDTADIIDASLFVIAAVDPDGGGSDFSSYIVTGDQTQPGDMPSGTATFNGFSVATVYKSGSVQHSHPMTGDATIVANFDLGLVDIDLSGSHSSDSYVLTATGVEIDGSIYEGIGELTGSITADGVHTTNVATGDVIGAFYGDGAEATAGVFGAAGDDSATHLIEIVGGFGAYVD